MAGLRAALARRGRVAGPALVAGVGLALSLPPWGWWPLAFAGAGILWWRLGGLGLWSRLLAGFACGLGLFVTGLWWSFSFSAYGGVALIVVQSLFLAAACVATPPRRGRAVALAGAMVIAEAVRSTWPFGGLPLGGVALGQAAGPLAGAARLGGPLLVVGLVWLGGAGVGLLVSSAVTWWANRRATHHEPIGWRQLAEHAADNPGPGAPPPPPPPPPSLAAPTAPAAPTGDGAATPAPQSDAAPQLDRAPLVGAGVVRVRVAPVGRPALAGLVAAVVVAAVAGGGALAPDGGKVVSTERVAAVQGGGVRGLRKAQVSPQVVYDAQLSATATIPVHDGGRPPALVVWPEDVVALDEPLTSSPVDAQLSALAVSLRATLVVGVTETVTPTTFRNEVVAYAPSGKLVARYEKVHRVPFGEYIPWRGFFSHLANLSAVPQDAIPGHGDGVLHTPAGRLGTMVSYEVFFARRGWVATRAGAGLLIVPTNTASYSTSQVPSQEVAADRLQAIAEGRDLVQSATTGYSTFVDDRGRLIAHTTLGRRQVLVVTVSMRSGRTFYERVGDPGPLVVAAVLLALGWVAELTNVEVNELARRERQARAARDEARVSSTP